MVAIAKDDFISCLTEGKEYEVLAEDGLYILIKEDNGRLVWNYAAMFSIIGKLERSDKNLKIKVNYDII